MINLIDGSGPFFIPLLLCSILGAFIIVERLIALRTSRVLPKRLMERLLEGRVEDAQDDSVAGRILHYAATHRPDADQLRAFAQLEITRLERGLFWLEIVVSAAPLLGLLGTVTGLVKVFSNISPTTGVPDQGAFASGVALALTTTILGLAIAIPALVGNLFITRRIDTLAARLNVGVERLIDGSNLHRHRQP